jgi:glycosyltransferase involved in cell wall biosynthesis
MCLGGDYSYGVKQEPFQGKLDYDYIMWIDSDILFTPENFFSLLEHDKDIVSGLYMMADNQHYAVSENWSDDKKIQNGDFDFVTREKLAEKDGLFKVAYSGLGWMLVKKGVFESLEYPWFRPMWTEITDGDKIIKDFASEDATFCKMVAEKGFDVWVDPKVVVGHEKKMII